MCRSPKSVFCTSTVLPSYVAGTYDESGRLSVCTLSHESTLTFELDTGRQQRVLDVGNEWNGHPRSFPQTTHPVFVLRTIISIAGPKG